MFQLLRVKNFQAHAQRKLDLAHPIVVIVGCSDSGKSAIIRALRWVCRNVPNGDSFIREGAKNATASLSFDDGREVVRKRGAGGNLYFVDGTELKSFGVQPPDSVVSALKVADINFQGQHDSPYWFGESNGEVSRQLNAIVNLGIIDETLGYAAGVVRNNRTRLELLRGQRRDAEASVAACAHFEELDTKLAELERQQDALHALRTQAEELEETLSALVESRSTRKRLKVECSELASLLALANALRDVAAQRSGLESSLTLIATAQAQSTPPPSIAPLQRLHDAAQGISVRAQTLDDFLEELRDAWRSRKAAQLELAESQADFKKKVGDVCPICGGPLSHEH